MATINFNQKPHFDDFDEGKKFYRVLYRPGFPVQARELTQQQTILQNQIERLGTHLFDEGALIIPGDVALDDRFSFIRVEPSTGLNSQSDFDANWKGRKIEGSTNAIQAIIVGFEAADVNNDVTLFLKYLNSDPTTGLIKTFQPEEVVTVIDGPNPGLLSTQLIPAPVLIGTDPEPTGEGTAATIRDGVYFIRGFFVRVDEQIVIINKESTLATASVGLLIQESIVTAQDDPTLNDNAQGSTNFLAPGADRLKIDLILTSRDPNDIGTSNDEDFIELLRVIDGEIQILVNRTSFNIIGDELARRTFAESGNYTVRPFLIDIQDHPTDTSKLQIAVESGKAFVRGYEIETLGKRFIDLDKAQDSRFVNNSTINTLIGNFIEVQNLHGLPNTTSYDIVELYDAPTHTPGLPASDQLAAADGLGLGSLIGTARMRGFEYAGEGAPATPNGVYNAFLFDVQTNPGRTFDEVKQVFSNLSPEPFTADVNTNEISLAGGVSSNSSTGPITIDGDSFTRWVSQESQRLQVGHIIKINTVNDGTAGGILPNGILVRVTQLPTVDNSLEVEFIAELDIDGNAVPGVLPVTTLPTITGTSPEPLYSFSNSSFSFVFATLERTSNNGLLFQMPNNFIETIRDQSSAVDTNYTVRRKFTNQTVGGVGNGATLTGNTFEEFLPFSASDYVAVVNSGSAPTLPGDLLPIQAIDISFPTTTQVRIENFPATVTSVDIIASIRKTQGNAAQEKTKTLQTNAIISSPIGQENLREFSLSKADIFNLVSVHMSSDFTTAPTVSDTDITSRYTFNTGQRDNFYGLGSISLLPGQAEPTGRILVTFDYFVHSTNGNYFSVDSYAIPYEDIPEYKSTDSGDTFRLADVLDFRPRINDAGTAFDNSTGSLTEIPKTNVSADFSFFLNRIDKLFLDTNGQFHIKKGVPEIFPESPEDPTEGMVLYQLNVRAFTIDKNEVFPDFIENKNYEMRDIGKLEKRIEKLEFYTSLSLLETETESLKILDADGLDRFKNGFLVDPFQGHGIGDVENVDYQCSIDMDLNELRPIFYEDFVSLDEENQTDVERTSDGYQKTGDLITLPYTVQSLINQPVASSPINVNPFNVFTFLGTVNLDPPFDQWKDTKQLPDLLINREGNFDSMARVSRSFGTVWNEWQEHWTGTPVTNREVTRKIIERGENPPDAGHRQAWPALRETITRTTTTQTGSKTRSGVRLRVIPRIITQNLGDRVVNVAWIPFMRSKDVVITASRFKPETNLYAFFDDIDVGSHVSSGSTFNALDTIDTGTALITDQTGKATATFRIPNTDVLKFKTGERVLRLTDRINNDDDWTTSGEGIYRSQGLLETKQRTIVSTRNAELVREVVTENQSLSRSTTEVQRKTKWIDPLAQSFLITKEGGVFLPQIDLFFESKDSLIPVTLEIREMVNGSPGQRVIPFGEVVLDAVDINTNEVQGDSLFINGVDQGSGVTPTANNFQATTFTFDSPVYLREGEEYCFVVISNSNNYNIWRAKASITNPENRIGTEIPIAENPYAGSMFKSQNASTWTPEQESDIMFNIHQCIFDTSTTGLVTLTNEEIENVLLVPDPFTTKAGSFKVRVNQPDHGFREFPSGLISPKVTLSGVSGLSNLVNGIPISELNTEHNVTEIEHDSYVIEVSTPATDSGGGGGESVEASQDMPYEVLRPLIGHMILPETDISYSVRTTSSSGIHNDGTQQPYVLDDITNFKNIVGNENILFDSPRMIASSRNEQDDILSFTGSGSSKTLFVRGAISSTNENISPVIDTKQTNVIAISNRIDDPTIEGVNGINVRDTGTVASPNGDGLDDIILVSSNVNIAFNQESSTISSSDSSTSLALSRAERGKYLDIQGTTSNQNDGLWRVISVNHSDPLITIIAERVDGAPVTESAGASVSVVHLDRFISELAPSGGSTSSSYITRRMTLSDPATSLYISFAAFRDISADIDVYYRIQPVDNNSPFDDLPYIRAEVDRQVPVSAHDDDFREYTFTENDLDEYSTVDVKIVMRGSNPAFPPRIKDLRVIALAT